MSVFQETVCRLRECVEEAQASSKQGTSDTAAAQHSLRELRLELASTQASHRESMELVRALLTHSWLSRVVRLQVYVVSCPACSRGAPSCQRREGARRRGPGSWLQSSTDYVLPADTGRGKGLQEEKKRLKAELEESMIEAESFRTSQASMSGQRSALTRPPVQLLHTESALTATGALSGQRDNLWRRSSGCQPASALAPDSACVCLAGRGATFAAEVARRVALRTLERRPLPCGHHRWSRPTLSAGTSHALHISGRDTGGG